MSSNWYAGSFAIGESTWHHLETQAVMESAADMIRAGEESGAWPLAVSLESMVTESGLAVPGKGVVATYADGSRRCHKAMSDRYRYLDPKEWRATIEAAVKAGAKPIGAFALGGEPPQKGERFFKYTSPGGKILATFDIGRSGVNGGRFVNHLNLADSLDGSCSYVAGGSSIRVVCANTFAAWMGADGKSAAKIRHTASIGERAEVLREAIHEHVTSGESVAKAYMDARQVALTKPDIDELLNRLFPAPPEADKTKALARARALNLQTEAAAAMLRPENVDGGPTLASLWNAATWMVDRSADEKTGEARLRGCRGGADLLESMLFGSRGARVEKIRQIMITVLRPDGTEEEVTAAEAHAAGIDHGQIGRAMLGEMLS